ncbi:triacylglycerol lipase [Nocardioides sp. R-C-SC26]|uniref:esterase/lipase family protein n=1 Tax=Nocardioides sp. R-C-SC26 TaxID=2870414 RepID=UPI001E503ECC|nr:alpha/beta fold hydrolase [Nocardioides sp. R-C-SC26]
MARRNHLTALLTSVVVALATAVALLGPAAPSRAADPATVSSGLDDWMCRPSADHPRPVVLIHGLGANAESNWALHGPALAKAGYCAFSLTYGQTSVTRWWGGGGFAPVDDSAREIGAFIDRVLAETGAAQVDLVGHSEGAFQSLYVPKVTGYAAKVGRVVALAPPTHGTTFAGIVSLGRLVGGQRLVNFFTDGAGCFACTDLIKGGPAVARLVDGPIAQPGVTYTIISSKYDAIVTPVSTGFVREPGVTNYYVQDKCRFDPVGHVGIAVDTGVTSMILNGLDPSVPVRCGFGPPF